MTRPPSADPATYTARCPEDLLAMVPIVLGFHPRDSVVLLTFGSPAGAFHARIDLPQSLGEVDEVVATLAEAVERNRPASTALMVLGEDTSLGREVAEQLVPTILRLGADVIDVVQADGRHWWSVPVGEPDAVPERWPYDVRDHPFTAERVYGGHTTYATREELVASLRPADPAVAARFVIRVDARRGEVHAAIGGDGSDEIGLAREQEWLDALTAPPSVTDPPDADAARLVVLADVAEVRDGFCLGLTRRSAAEQLPLWRSVVSRTPPEPVGGVASVLALVPWLAGDGALAWCAIDRCREVDPDNSLAGLVAAALQSAVPPTAWETVRPAR